MYLSAENALRNGQVGRDPRITGPLLAAALVAGLTSKGVRVARFGLATTPAMFMSCITAGAGSSGLGLGSWFSDVLLGLATTPAMFMSCITAGSGIALDV